MPVQRGRMQLSAKPCFLTQKTRQETNKYMLIFSNGKYKNEFFLPFKNQLLKMLTQYMYFLDFFIKNIFAIQKQPFSLIGHIKLKYKIIKTKNIVWYSTNN